MKKLLLLLCMLISLSTIAQQKKLEKEERIAMDEMPQLALDFLKAINFTKEAKKSRFYKEFDGNQQSFEAKGKYRNLIYSIEFSEDGNLQDIEVWVKKSRVPKQVLQRITDFLKRDYDATELEKIQMQFKASAHENNTATFARSRSLKTHSPDNYECTVMTRKEGAYDRFEMTFDASGSFKHKRKLVEQTHDDLDF